MTGEQGEATREVAENTKAGQAVGNPVVAEDKDGDVLTYTLSATGDSDGLFSIDWATGQIKTKEDLDFETAPQVTVNTEQVRAYAVMVTATDPSAVPAAQTAATVSSDTVTVNIIVTDVNEPPAVTGDAAVTYMEDAGTYLVGDTDVVLGAYMAVDPDDDNNITWSVSGADAGKFDISTGGMLTFKATAQPDFEKPGDANKDNVYEVTVGAADEEDLGNRGAKAVKVTVANEDEDGVVALSRTQPRVGVEVTASLTDPDDSISSLRWQWYRGANITADNLANLQACADATPDNCSINDATSDAYTPTADDVTRTLNAVASYTDGEAEEKVALGEADHPVVVDTRNKPPAFEDQDKKASGTQNETATREVEEKTGANATDDAAADDAEVVTDNVGSVIAAKDPDPNADPLIYTLSGADAGSFRVRDNGQIEVGAGTKLDYETKDTYMVTLTAEDSFGASASIMVTIMVTDLDEPPKINEGGLAISGVARVDYAEDRRDAVGTYTASGPDAASATWTLGGDDYGDFEISSSGELTFVSAPDYENAADADGDNEYLVTVMAMDSESNTDTLDVVVTVADVEEPVIDDPIALYDDNSDGTIDSTEVLAAVSAYFNDEIDASDVLAVVAKYFSDARSSS